jgi:hypothetical protein
MLISATKGNTLREEWIAYIAREILRVNYLVMCSLYVILI